jgi:hypothetical protein
MWRVVFECDQVMLIPSGEARTALDAMNRARLFAWSATGRWLNVLEVTRE